MKYVFIFIAAFIINYIMLTFIPDEQPKQTAPKVESIKLGDKQTKVIVDDTTGCKYIVFNNKTLTPLYDNSGNVEGCGE